MNTQISEVKTTIDLNNLLEDILFFEGPRIANMTAYVFLELGKTEGRYNVANALLEEVKKGNFVEIKETADALGYNG